MTMTSRERMLAALDHQPVDHVPLLLRFWSLGREVDNIPFDWHDQVRRVHNTLALGLDDTLLLQPPLGYVEDYVAERAPGVRSRVEWLPTGESDRYPLLKKVYETPEGPLQTVVNVTEDWPRGSDIHMFDDYNLSRLKEPLVKDYDDLRRLKKLLPDPSQEQLDEFRRRAESLRREARRLGVVLEGGWTALGDAAMWLCGMERILYGQMDEPEFIEAVLETVFQWELKRTELLLREGIDVLVHMAWYETTDFWTPRNYRCLIKPRLQQLIHKAHAHGARFRYIITKSWKSYCQDFLEMGLDCLTGVDPVQDHIDLAEVKAAIGERVCLMGGVNSAVMLSQWGEARIREAVDQAIGVLAPGGGFILHPVDAVFNTQPWEKVQILIDRWRCTQNLGR